MTSSASASIGRAHFWFLTGMLLVLCLVRPSESRQVVSARTIQESASIFSRGGARGQPAQWSASPLGIRRKEERGSYPVVQDLDDDENIGNRQESKEMLNAFLTRDSRNTFITRVYAILSGQLLVTALSIVYFGTHPELSAWMRDSGSFVPIASFILSAIAWFIVCSSPRARHESPMKWQLLALFTVGESISIGFISSLYKFQSVLSALLATAVATTSISVYTVFQKNPNYDLSQWGMGLSSVGMIFLVYSLVHLLDITGVLPQGFLPYRESVFGLLGAGLFSFYLAYHTKLIVGGKHSKFQMNEKDYVFGAMSLYNDIINIFLYILRMIGEDNDK